MKERMGLGVGASMAVVLLGLAVFGWLIDEREFFHGSAVINLNSGDDIRVTNFDRRTP